MTLTRPDRSRIQHAVAESEFVVILDNAQRVNPNIANPEFPCEGNGVLIHLGF